MPNIQLQMSQGRLFAFLLPFNVRTLGFTLPEALTQRKSKRPIEGLVCIVLFGIFPAINDSSAVLALPRL